MSSPPQRAHLPRSWGPVAHAKRWLKWAVSLALLALTLAFIDVDTAWQRLAHARVDYIALALLLSLPLLATMAARWHFTTARLGVPIGFATAYREYYVSTLLNQVLPGGVAGDFARVARHRGADKAALARSVILERGVGQVVLWLVVVVSTAVWGFGTPLFTTGLATGLALVGVVAALALVYVVGNTPRIARTPAGALIRRMFADARTATLSRGALVIQLGLSLLALALLIVMFHACALAVGAHLTLIDSLCIVPCVLAATTIPLTVGGWGVREMTAAGLFTLIGLAGHEGAAAGAMFGAVSLLAALPGVVLLCLPQPQAVRL